jgi:glyoxylase-like metal-dependent hydrolase (beta-lactamase superfamily II)
MLGPVQTNSYLVYDRAYGQAVVIDPAWDGEYIAEEAKKRNCRISSVWITHAHFDHLAGCAGLAEKLDSSLVVALHPFDYPLWRMEGGARLFGMRIDPGPEPTVELTHGMQMQIGKHVFEVRHTPGHTPGHVVFACFAEKVVFVGDLIFAGSIGRTDLPGGDYELLMESIQCQVLNLPENTRIFPGHGPTTTIAQEMRSNPFIATGGI